MKKILGGVVAAIGMACGASAAEPPRKLVIFDIDDTLVDTNYRTQEILHEVGAELGLPELMALTFDKTDYFCSKSVQNAGLSDPGVASKVCGDFAAGTQASSPWGRRFFSSAYLRFDHVIAGAPQFVDRVQAETGADIVFLTGRSEAAMGEGTRAQLAYYGFLDKPGRTLITKGDAAQADVEHKRSQVRRLAQQYCIVGSFDDSKSNNAMFAQELGASVPLVQPQRVLSAGDLSAASPVRITNYFYDVQSGPAGAAPTPVANSARLDGIIAALKSVRCP